MNFQAEFDRNDGDRELESRDSLSAPSDGYDYNRQVAIETIASWPPLRKDKLAVLGFVHEMLNLPPLENPPKN
jgi:hypothetical protein